MPSSCGICTIKPINVLDSTTQTVALVTYQGRGHRSPAPSAAHPLQLEELVWTAQAGKPLASLAERSGSMDLLQACDEMKGFIETAQKLIESWEADPDNYSKLEEGLAAMKAELEKFKD